jgi:glycosyltransferase involved in cell wall biosynthesis
VNRLRQSQNRPLKRVLFVLNLDPSGKFGSLEEQTMILARAFQKRNSLFLPVFLRRLDPESASQYARDRLASEAMDLNQFRLSTLNRLRRLIRTNRINIVHWNFYHPLFNGYLWALSITNPTVEHYFTDHISRPAGALTPGDRVGLKSKLKKVTASRYRKILCISDYVRAWVRPWAGPRAERIHYFVNTDRFAPNSSARREVRQTLGVGEEFVAVVVAHLIKDKGIDVAIRAVAQLPGEPLLWIVGQGPEQESLQAMIESLGLCQRVRFVGPRRQVEPLMQAADCALCPSVWSEAVGLVNLEALACGLPVIASRVGGIPEFIEDGLNGFLFTPGDVYELVERIRRLMDDEPLRRRMSQQARANSIARDPNQRLLEDYLGFYH